MSIPFTPWPEEFARRYREAGYWIDRPLTDILEHQARVHPQGLALICGERRFSYGEMAQQVRCLAANLRARGLRPQDTALVQLPNVAEFYLVFFALLSIGVVPVNALFSHRRLELVAYAKQVRPRLLIASRSHPSFADDQLLDALCEILPERHSVLLLGEQDAQRSLAAALDGEAPRDFTPDPGVADQVALFQLSGGSTATPKLIPRTHNDYFYSIRRSAEICRIGPDTRFLCAMPAAHNYLMSSPGALGIFHAGGTVVLAPHPEPATCFALIERHQVNMAALVPSAVTLWLQAVSGRREQVRSLELLQVGGASFADALARRVPGEFGCRLQQVFGMAEGLVNYTRLDDDEAHVFTTQGFPMCPDDEVRVLDSAGRELPAGEVGQLATRGPYTIRGYFQSPEHNARAFDAEGFYLTGDLVCHGADGYLRVVGRVKDQINRGGEKIASEEIEQLLMCHEAVDQVGLVAIPDLLLGEKSCAFIASRHEELSPAQLRRFLREQGVAEYKLPDRFQKVPELPLTAVGKIDKLRLRAWLQGSLNPCAA